MWTKANRGKYNRDGLALSERFDGRGMGAGRPLIPPAKRGGRRREIDVREVLSGPAFCAGCQWRAVPKGLPAHSADCDQPFHAMVSGHFI